MGNDKFRRFLLCFFLHALFQCDPVETTSIEVVVEGDRGEIKCRTNSSYTVDWLFINATSNYEVAPEGRVPKKFMSDYEVSSTNESSYKISYLSLKRTKLWHVGTYRCRQGEDQRILTSIQLVLLTFPKCELDSSSNFTICKSISVGNISTRSEWIGNSCTNSTPTKCSSTGEENVSCEFPINGRNRTFLPFAPNITSHKLNVCEIRCIYSEPTSDADFQKTSVNLPIQFSVLMNCSVKPFSTTKAYETPHEEMGHNSLVYGSIAAFIAGVLLAVTIFAIFRNISSAETCKNNESETFYQELGSAETSPNNGDESSYQVLESPYSEISENVLLDTNPYASVPNENPVGGSSVYITVIA